MAAGSCHNSSPPKVWMSSDLTIAPPDIGSCCMQLLYLLALFAEHAGLTTTQMQLFYQLWTKIVDLSRNLPGPHRNKTGRDNYGRPYIVEACIHLPNNMYFERRFFPKMKAVSYLFSNRKYGPRNFFHYNPEGNFYGSYYALTGGLNGLTVKIKGIKLSKLALKTYEYPPDIPARERGGKAERYNN